VRTGRQRERETHRHTHTQRETDAQTQRMAEKDRQRETYLRVPILEVRIVSEGTPHPPILLRRHIEVPKLKNSKIYIYIYINYSVKNTAVACLD